MKPLKVDITKRLGSFELKVSFDTSSSGRFALLGSSGSGKSMTLKCIAGLVKPDSGRITLGDRVLFDSEKKIDLPPRDRHAGYLFQDYALFPKMTAFENINIVCRNDRKTEELLKRFNIFDVKDRRPSQMSGGQCQRTALARMLASDPEVIFLDEPFSALDNYMHTIIEREILDVLEDFDGPSVLVSHDRNEVYRMCDTIGVIENGTFTGVQDRDGFFGSPQSVSAARLTGCKNITLLQKNGFAEDWGIKLELPAGTDLEKIRYAGYRAHYLTVAGEEERGLPNVFDAQVVRVIEDTFSSAILFRQKGNPSDSPDSVLTYITDKGFKCDGELLLRIDPQRLILMER